MERILITGFSGFVASHFIEYLYFERLEYKIYGIDIKEPEYDYSIFKDKLDIKFKIVDMIQFDQIRDLVAEFNPDYILHLASFSSVAYSWEHPLYSFMNNSSIFLNMISAVQEMCPKCRVLSVGSSEEYGNVKHENLPIRENQPVNPGSPYAVARVSQEMLSKVFVDAYSIDIIMTRSFNHIGPRQDVRFAIPGFVRKMLDIKESGNNTGEIETGNLSIVRDFVDVRDVVKAYYLLLMKGRKGEIYNICSGKGRTLKEVVDVIADEIGIKITTKINPIFIRPNENMEIVGTSYKLESELGWKRQYDLRKTISDIVLFMSEKCSFNVNGKT